MIEQKKLESYSEEEQKELKKFRKGFRLFMIGEIFLVISALSKATAINGVPQILGFLGMFAYVAFILFFISLFILRPSNRSFSYSFISFCICVILKYIVYLCGVSPNTIDNQMGMGFGWAQAFCECVFYLYFFHGCLLFFEKYNFVKGPREFKVFVIVFASVFFVKEVFEYLSTASFIKVHRFANRFFLYGNWVLIFILYVFGLVAVIMISKYLNKQIEFKPKKEKKRHE